MDSSSSEKSSFHSEKEKVFFGFQEVSWKEKTQKVHEVFTSVASRYDGMNDVMSLGAHRLWKNIFVRLLSPSPGMNILDMAGGSGDIALRILQRTRGMTPPVTVTLCDINPSMLEQARAKAVDQGILESLSYACMDASSLTFSEDSYDAYTIAFGIRNVTDIPAALREAYRVLKPQGRFLCLEFSKIGLPFLARLYKNYAFQVIPRLGKWMARDEPAYRYLVESIEKFPCQEDFSTCLRQAGFKGVRYRNLFNGLVAIHSGFKESP